MNDFDLDLGSSFEISGDDLSINELSSEITLTGMEEQEENLKNLFNNLSLDLDSSSDLNIDSSDDENIDLNLDSGDIDIDYTSLFKVEEDISREFLTYYHQINDIWSTIFSFLTSVFFSCKS